MRKLKRLSLARAAMTLLLVMLTTMTAWAEDVNLTEDTEETEGTAARWYVNMPSGGKSWYDKACKYLTLADDNITSFKVYDDGGKSGNYSDNCYSQLTITAPTGYILKLSGSITTQSFQDYMFVYDNSTTSGTTLLAGVYSASSGAKTDIATVYSSGQSMTIYFCSNGNNNYAGLDLTVTLVKATLYNVTVGTATGGTVTANPTSTTTGQTVTLTATPASGYVLNNITATDGNNAVVATGGTWYNNIVTFRMPESDVTVTSTFNNDLTANSLSVNIPKTGHETITIPSGVQSFKVYDDGGPNGNASGNCYGTLTLTAPDGYVLYLSGSVTTMDGGYDYLRVYDNSEASGTKLIDAVRSPSDGTPTAITPVTSTGKNMTLYFTTHDYSHYAGLDLTVTVLVPTIKNSVTVNNPAKGGTMTASPTSAEENETVTLTASPDNGYVLNNISVVDVNSNPIAMTWDGMFFNTATFKMPASTVTVTPTFTNDLTVNSLFVNMPKTGERTATIPMGVQSFKAYDDGGKDGDYSSYCDGTLTLTAPEGYRIQLSGSITTETAQAVYDYLSVYDGIDNTATELIHQKCSPTSGTPTDITTVYSSGRSLTLYFHSYYGSKYAGLDLTVTVYNPTGLYSVNINNATGGTMTATPSGALMNETVTLTATPDNGFFLSGISAVDGNSNAVGVTWDGSFNNTATFTMPSIPTTVTVTPTFTNTLTADGGLFANMPKKGYKTTDIPKGVQSFKIYDDGGKDGNYSAGCGGYLTLTAPEGYRLQLSGTIASENHHDNLNVWDNSTNSGTKLLDEVSSPTSGTPTTITTVTSSGRNMTLLFYDDGGWTSAGLDLTATLVPITYTVSFNANGGSGDAMAAQSFTYDEAQNLTANSYTAPLGYTFAGWATTANGDVVYADGESVSNLKSTQGANLELFAKWTKNEFALLNDDSEAAEKNSTIISSYANDGKVYEVTLSGRTLWKDGDWNTFVLPFNVTLAGSPLEGATAMKLNGDKSSFDNGVLTLNFVDEKEELTAGTPYIIKWDGDGSNNLVNPVFTGVTIDKTDRSVSSVDGKVTFTGNYDYRTFIEEDKSILFLGEKNTLYWPQPGLDDAKANVVYPSIGACRAYFKLNDVDAGDIQKTRMNFEEETTGIQTTNSWTSQAAKPSGTDKAGAWYDMQGRKVSGKPTKKGMYIHNGIKVVIK